MLKHFFYIIVASFIFLFSFPFTVDAAQYDCSIQYSNVSVSGNADSTPAITDAQIEACCYLEKDEPYKGIACRPEDKFLQQLGGVVTCTSLQDLKNKAESQQSQNRANFNCFTGSTPSACRAGWCSDKGVCKQAGSSCPANLNRVNVCPGACGSCNADSVYCPVAGGQPQNPGVHQGPNYAGAVQCQLKKYGPQGQTNQNAAGTCKSLGKGVANFCTGECTGCSEGFTESGRNQNACIPFAQRFIEILEDGLSDLGGTNRSGRYDYSDSGPANLSSVYLKADVSEALNFNSAQVPPVLKSLLAQQYNFCSSSAQCGANGQCASNGICFNPKAALGDSCTNDSSCNMLLGHACKSDKTCGSSVVSPLGGSGVWTQSGNNIFYEKGQVRIGSLSEAPQEDLHIDRGLNSNVSLRLESDGRNSQSIGFGGNTIDQTNAFQYTGSPYGFRIGRIGNSDFNNDAFVIDREEGLGTFKARLLRLESGGDLSLTSNQYKNCSSLKTDATGKLSCGSGSGSLFSSAVTTEPIDVFPNQFQSVNKVSLDQGVNWLSITSNRNTAFQPTRLGVGTSSPAAALHVLNTGTNNAWNQVGLTNTTNGHVMIGSQGGQSLTFDTNTIQSRSNPTTASTLELNRYGGDITLAEGGGRVGIGTGFLNHTLTVDGTAAKTGGGSWTNSSDIRLKEILGDYNYGLEQVLQLEPVRFRYKSGNPRDLNDLDMQIGFVAQQVEPIFPDAVSVGEDGYLDLNMHSINVGLVNAIQEQQKIIEDLKRRIETLENSH